MKHNVQLTKSKRVSLAAYTLLFATLAATSLTFGQGDGRPKAAGELRNIPEREEEFMNWGLGLFVHWAHDSQLGSVISHHMDMASDKHLDRMINELPKDLQSEELRSRRMDATCEVGRC